MAKAARVRGRKTPAVRGGGVAFTRLALRTDTQAESRLLDLAGKADSHDHSRNLVRNGQFSDSYMMGTHGGATYEDGLRPPPRVTGAAADGPTQKRRRRALRPYGLHNTGAGADELVLISDVSRIPARSVAQLRIQPEDGEERAGTAWLIGPRVLATAAHNLIHPEVGPSKSILVGVGFDGESAHGGWHKAIDNAFPQAWRDNPSGDNPNDFAVLKIDDATVGNKWGWFGFANYEDAKFPSMILNVFGYPVEDVDFPSHLYASAGRVTNLTDSRIFYDCPSAGGMSGGPVIARFDEQRIAVGIHVAAGDSATVATRITAAAYGLFDQHKNW